MATYEELDNICNDEALLKKFRTALRASCVDIVDRFIADNTSVTAAEHQWARNTLRDPRYEAIRALGIFAWDKKAQTAADILASTEVNIKNRVAAIVPWLIAAQVGA